LARQSFDLAQSGEWLYDNVVAYKSPGPILHSTPPVLRQARASVVSFLATTSAVRGLRGIDVLRFLVEWRAVLLALGQFSF
jgi:hypothetical protein